MSAWLHKCLGCTLDRCPACTLGPAPRWCLRVAAAPYARYRHTILVLLSSLHPRACTCRGAWKQRLPPMRSTVTQFWCCCLHYTLCPAPYWFLEPAAVPNARYHHTVLVPLDLVPALCCLPPESSVGIQRGSHIRFHRSGLISSIRTLQSRGRLHTQRTRNARPWQWMVLTGAGHIRVVLA